MAADVAGARANTNGKMAEDMLSAAVRRLDATFERQRQIGASIYGTPLYVDFWLPERQLIIESKHQSSTGSADEKLPYLAENILAMYPMQTIVVMSGEGFRAGAIFWLRQKLKDAGHLVFDMNEFTNWAAKQ